jgi:dTDP-4-amino-4,6-dideoxygalactose transaminase
MDPEQLQKRATRQPIDAVVPVHLYGQCADMDAITAVANQSGMTVIEDAAQAHGATYKGRPAGCFGDAAAYSFYAGKNLGAAGEAGAVVTNDDAIADKINMLRDHGQSEKYIHETEGTNSRLDALQARFLSIKLPHLDGWNAQRRLIADIYDAVFQSEQQVQAVHQAPDQLSSRHLYIIHVPDRQSVCDYLARMEIGTGLHYPIPLHLQDCYAHLGLQQGDFPHAEQSAATLLSLPIHPEMTASDAERVAAAVLDAL